MESILVVDDDINFCNILSEELNDAGYNTNFLSSGENVVEFLNDNKTNLVLLDLNMPGKDGFKVQGEINSRSGSKTKVIILTGYSDERSALKSARLGASDYLCKPYDITELLVSIKKVLQDQI
jgi:DNA-binding response OmpR family regulator